MAGWSELLVSSLPSMPRQVFICLGELSSLVWDKVNVTLEGYDRYLRVTRPEDMMYASYNVGCSLAYLAVDPSVEVIARIESMIRSGDDSSFYILVSDHENSPCSDYVKRKAQQLKQYYTVTPPKTDAARSKMSSFFQLRWGITRDQAAWASSLLKYSPGKLYMFDQQFSSIIGESMLSSSDSMRVLKEVLGNEVRLQVAGCILGGEVVDGSYDAEFTSEVLSFLHGLVDSAIIVQAAIRDGAGSVNEVCKASSITQFQVNRSWGLATAYSEHKLKKCRDSIDFGYTHASEPELLEVLSRMWGTI